MRNKSDNVYYVTEVYLLRGVEWGRGFQNSNVYRELKIIGCRISVAGYRKRRRERVSLGVRENACM